MRANQRKGEGDDGTPQSVVMPMANRQTFIKKRSFNASLTLLIITNFLHTF